MKKIQRLVSALSIVLLSVALTGCGSSEATTIADTKVKPLIEKGFYISELTPPQKNLDTVVGDEILATAFPVDEVNSNVKQLTILHWYLNLKSAKISNVGNGYFLYVTSVFQDSSIKLPRVELVDEKTLNVSFGQESPGSVLDGTARKSVIAYAVKLYLPEGYKIPSDYMKIFTARDDNILKQG